MILQFARRLRDAVAPSACAALLRGKRNATEFSEHDWLASVLVTGKGRQATAGSHAPQDLGDVFIAVVARFEAFRIFLIIVNANDVSLRVLPSVVPDDRPRRIDRP